MAGNINDFKSSFTQDVARPNKFDVDVIIPLVMIPYVSSARSLNYRCENAQLPGRTLATTEQKTYGPIEKYPYLNTYNDIDLTFIIDDDMQQKILFDAWLSYINPSYSNNMRYKSDYATILKINQYDVTGELSYSVNLYDAFPISMNQMDLDWSVDGYHKLSVTFAYTRWENNSLQALGMQLVDYGINQVADMVSGINLGSIGQSSYVGPSIGTNPNFSNSEFNTNSFD
jgi:hypothetical protein